MFLEMFDKIREVAKLKNEIYNFHVEGNTDERG